MLDILVSVLGALIVTYILMKLLRRLNSKLPPGPLGLPIVGYSPFLSDFPLYEFTDLQKKYGPVFGYYRGSLYTVVLGDYASIKEAFNKNEFLDRPPGFTFGDADLDNIVTMNGVAWRDTRRFVLTTLRNLGMGKNKVEQKIQEELSKDLERLEKITGTEVNIHKFFKNMLLNNIFSIIVGKTLEDKEPLQNLLSNFIEDFFSQVTVYQFVYPFLMPIHKVLSWILKKNPRDLPGFKGLDQFFWKEIEAHEKNFDENNLEDFIDYYISHMKKSGGENTYFNRKLMLNNAESLVIAAGDTTQASLDWIFLCMAKYPAAQEKVYQEIVEELGKERMPAWNDKDSLPYTNAFLMEVARVKTIAPASDPHYSSAEGTIQGFQIPKGTILLANLHAVHQDKKLWGDPEAFRPERFISSDGQKVIVPEYWIPFLIGKRMCPGEKLAVMQLFLTTATIVQRFRILPPESGLSLAEHVSFIILAKKPIVTFEMRS